MFFDGCGLPVWVPGPPWSHPWVLDVANLGQFSKLTKLKQLKLGKHKFNNILGPRGIMRLSLDGGKVLDQNSSLSAGNRMTNRRGLTAQTPLSTDMHSWMGWWGHAQRKEFLQVAITCDADLVGMASEFVVHAALQSRLKG